MAFDMYAYSTNKENVQYGLIIIDEDKLETIFHWHSHIRLHSYFEDLYCEKGGEDTAFNGAYMEITSDDINNLEKAIQQKTDYFYGRAYSHYQDDLDFIAKAREVLRKGDSLFYQSIW